MCRETIRKWCENRMINYERLWWGKGVTQGPVGIRTGVFELVQVELRFVRASTVQWEVWPLELGRPGFGSYISLSSMIHRSLVLFLLVKWRFPSQ